MYLIEDFNRDEFSPLKGHFNPLFGPQPLLDPLLAAYSLSNNYKTTFGCSYESHDGQWHKMSCRSTLPLFPCINSYNCASNLPLHCLDCFHGKNSECNSTLLTIWPIWRYNHWRIILWARGYLVRCTQLLKQHSFSQY